MGPYRKLWLILIAVVAITFALFGSWDARSGDGSTELIPSTLWSFPVR